VHHVLLGQEIVVVETLNNLDQVPDEFVFMGFPLNIKGRDGSPIRAVAIVE
jgi:kynurenine formamidase